MSDAIEEIKIIPKFPLTKEETELLSIVDENEEEIIDLLQKLVQINSMNLSADIFVDKTEIFEFTKDFMDKAGFKTEYYKAPFPSGKKNEFYYNLIVNFFLSVTIAINIAPIPAEALRITVIILELSVLVSSTPK